MEGSVGKVHMRYNGLLADQGQESSLSWHIMSKVSLGGGGGGGGGFIANDLHYQYVLLKICGSCWRTALRLTNDPASSPR